MHILLVGLNHRSAPIELREQLAFQREQLPEAFAKLRRDVGLDEVAILSTCNRVEIYAGVPELDGAIGRLQQFLTAHGRLEPARLSDRVYHSIEPHSIRHLFSVASGLDSMVLGEGEVLQQVKHAYELAKSHGATGKVLNVLFQKALHAAKAVRTQTAIGAGSTSIGSVAVELAQKIFGGLESSSVLLIGAGKISELTLTRLADRGVSRVNVMNRSIERAGALAVLHGATALPLEQLATQLGWADIVISSPSATQPLISRHEITNVMSVRRQRPLCLIDLGVPRNIDPAAGELENVYLFNVDDLDGLVAHYHRERQQAVEQARGIIEEKVGHFVDWWQSECRMPNVEGHMKERQRDQVVSHS